jgi:hypothetical protein
MRNFFFSALNLKATDNPGLNQFARKTGIPLERLFYYNRFNVIPSGQDLRLILAAVGISETALKLKMGTLDSGIQALIQENADEVARIIQQRDKKLDKIPPPFPVLVQQTQWGRLYQGDCLELMRHMNNDSVDLIKVSFQFKILPHQSEMGSVVYDDINNHRPIGF